MIQDKICINQALGARKEAIICLSGKIGGVKELGTRLSFVFAYHCLAKILILNTGMVIGLFLCIKLLSSPLFLRFLYDF